jgi:xanthine/CO dehydrogenase XdhC/CoxF family maturation factor
VSGPAGLNIAANTPAEIALSVIAEAVGHHNHQAMKE